MDSVTHTLFGLTLYGAVNKQEMNGRQKKAMFTAALIGSHIPDIDVVSQLWDTGGQYQMWHRGITHSIFMVPLWAMFIITICLLLWKVKDRRIFYLALGAVFIHNASDLFNAWGTGYLEPFSSVRVTFGTIPIVDFVIWAIMLTGFLYSRKSHRKNDYVYRWVWFFIVLHIALQTTQGYIIYQQHASDYEQHTLSASFVPGSFFVIGKAGKDVEVVRRSVWSEPVVEYELVSHESTDLDYLFEHLPEAKTLYDWAPFVVIVNNEERLGVYDPRFYRDGQSFLFEYIEK